MQAARRADAGATGPLPRLKNGDPWTLPVGTPPCLERFLIVLPLPQSERTALQEIEWLRAAVYHELEHVAQFCLRKDYLLLRAWRSFAEACAVAKEQDLAPGNPAALDYAHDFRSRLIHGLTGPLAEFGYHLYSFIQWIDRRHSGITDEVWRDQKVRPGYPDPLELLNEQLAAATPMTTLDAEWRSFCRMAVHGSRGGPLAPLLERHGRIIPTAVIDLQEIPGMLPWLRQEGTSYVLRLPVNYWSCHVIRFFNESSRTWTVTARIDGMSAHHAPPLHWGLGRLNRSPCSVSSAKRPRDITFVTGGGSLDRSNLLNEGALASAELVIVLS